MSKFIKLLVFFLIPVLIGLLTFEVLLRNIPNDYAFKRNYLNHKSNDVEMLFLGNSHIYFGINPLYIKRKTFNEAHISQSLNFDLAILEKYKDNWKSLKYIIVPIDYFSMYSSMENGIEKWREKNYNIYYHISLNSNIWNNFEVVNTKFPVNFFRVKSFYIDKIGDITCNEYGFGTTYNSKDSKNLIETGQTASKRHTIEPLDNNVFSKNIQTVNSLIEFSKKRNIKIIFITCPAYKTYTSKLKSFQLNNTINKIKKLSHESTNAYYYNFLTDSTFVASDYFDADHLNEIGAKKFTLKVENLINTIESKNRKK